MTSPERSQPVSAVFAAESASVNGPDGNILGCPAARRAENGAVHLDLLVISFGSSGTAGQNMCHPGNCEQQNPLLPETPLDIHEGRRMPEGSFRTIMVRRRRPVRFTGAGYRRFVPSGVINHRSAGDIQTLKTIPVAHFCWHLTETRRVSGHGPISSWPR